ncbi:ketopantoate reductase family protein [Polluticoccus soli]|uniref:ketopantoate reductase family protein n=1 Tax=Polluticoccus soli TaxID=3034150 RepID=UPI0023E2ED96|nr:2-dehydropantoate 2-reductase [Flavipsychrobacter sp. JY13-12]
MTTKYRIAILGIGGVGGFIGGRLAACYSGGGAVEVVFIARGENLEAIKKNGLQLTTAYGEDTVHPDIVTDNANEIGPIDLLICCTKTYGLEESLAAVKNAVTENTVILPLLNGVDNAERVAAIFPQAKVLHGLIYIVSKLVAPGVVQQKGEFHAVHTGSDSIPAGELGFIHEVLDQAGINHVPEKNIVEKIWSKFSFISPVASYTSAYNISIGQILEDTAHSHAVTQLMNEVIALAGSTGIQLPADTVAKNFEVMSKLPYEATSSMQADFAAGRKTELEKLTGYVVKQAAAHGLILSGYAVPYGLLQNVAGKQD